MITAFRHRVRAAELIAALLLASCNAGPAPGNLASDLQTYIEDEFSPGLLEVVAADWSNSPLLSWPEDETNVEYDAVLKVRRFHDFGNWHQPNAAALLNLLGAEPTESSGITPAGNKAGDLIQINGRIAYVKDGENWRIRSGANSSAIKDEESGPAHIGLISRIWSVASTGFDSTDSPAHEQIVTEELEAAERFIAARIARIEGGLAVASGPQGTVNWRLVNALARVAGDHDTSAVNIPVKDSFEALNLLKNERVNAAIIQNNEASMAILGTGSFESFGSSPNLRVLASLYPKPIHILVLAGSPIASASELADKRAAYIESGIASYIEAGDVLRAHRVPLVGLAEDLNGYTFDEGISLLTDGSIDALIATAASPAAPLHALLLEGKARILPLDSDAIALMTSGTSNYIALTIPAWTYPGQRRPIVTAGVAATLVTLSSEPTENVENILNLVFGKLDYVRLGSPIGALISRQTKNNGLTIPTHIGADAFFENISSDAAE